MTNSEAPDWRAAKLAAGVGAALVGTAGAHRLQFGSPHYATSALIPLALGLTLVLLVLLGVQPFILVARVFSKRRRPARTIAAAIVICIVAWALASALDPATLLYAT